jgi:hypothetical protein
MCIILFGKRRGNVLHNTREITIENVGYFSSAATRGDGLII